MEGLRLPGLEEDFALVVAEGDQGWGKDSRPEDGEQCGVLLFCTAISAICILGPSSAARNTLDPVNWLIKAGRK